MIMRKTTRSARRQARRRPIDAAANGYGLELTMHEIAEQLVYPFAGLTADDTNRSRR